MGTRASERTSRGTAVAALLLVGLLAAGSAVSCTTTGSQPPPATPAPVRPGPTGGVVAPPLGTAGLAQRVDAFLGASKWGRYDRISAVLVVVDGRTVVDRRRPDLPEQPQEVGGFTATVLVSLVGILLDRSDPRGSPVPAGPGALGTEGLRGVRRPVGELVAGPLPPALAPLAGTPLRDLLVGTSMDDPAPLAELLTAATGRPVPELAHDLLFAPMGIDPPWTATGPAVTAEDMAALGALWLDRGVVAGRQVVPAAWVDESSRPFRATGRPRLSYAGYRQWVTRAGGHAAIALTGDDGQLVEAVPALRLLVVVASDPDPRPRSAFPAGSEAFVELVSGTVVPALG
jgi:hypothetical protein